VLVEAIRRRQRPYRSSHPLAIPRTALALDLIRACGALHDDEIVLGRTATPEELARFHDPAYVAAILAAEHEGGLRADALERFGLGNLENPYFEQIYTIPATATGGSLQAAEHVIAGRMAFNPAGGMHHARPGRAAGFCYFNDPALAVLRLRAHGWRVLYVDIDAHHADAVEEAFLDDPAVLTLSMHMDTARAYPFHGGRVEDCGSVRGGHTTINVPLPHGTHDAEYALLFDAVWPRVVERFAPDVVVLQAGADMLAADPLGRLAMSTQGYLGVVARVLALAPRHASGVPRLLVTGGGGYHPLLVARAWTGVWALLSGRNLPDVLPPEGAAVLRAVGWDRDAGEPWYERLFTHRTDEPSDGPVRDAILRLREVLLRHPFLDLGSGASDGPCIRSTRAG